MDPITISLLAGLAISGAEALAKLIVALRGQPMTPEQRTALDERIRLLTAAIEGETPVPAPPGGR